MNDSINFDRAASFYDATRGFAPGIEQQSMDLIVNTAALTADQVLLEVAVGTGRISLPLSWRVKAAHGIDISRAMLTRLRQKQTGQPLYVVQGDATALPYPEQCFDAVIVVHALHLIAAWRQVIDEIRRVLKPEGVLILGGGRNRRDDLTKAWRQLGSSENTEPVGAKSIEAIRAHLLGQDWRLGTEAEITFPRIIRLGDIVQKLEDRCWSHTWRLTDEELALYVKKTRDHLENTYGDLDQKVDLVGVFDVWTWYPPLT